MCCGLSERDFELLGRLRGVNGDLHSSVLVADYLTSRFSLRRFCWDGCLNVQWRKRCDFYEPHNAVFPVSAIEWAGYEKFNPTAYLEKEEADAS